MKSEQVGAVQLNLSQYSGTDYYSDGDIEQTLLELVQSHTPEQYEQVIAAKQQWPILYHLSENRGNIVDWLPITKEDHVLEVGAGCGAITGTLCRMAKQVTCIELSRQRSLINATRNKSCDNLEILVGNFQDIEPTLPVQYDYILLIGVFEYGASYISDAVDPYGTFLSILKRHLKPDGKLVIAIENKFGLKYWAGCKEDHAGRYFEGLEGYTVHPGAVTFSKPQLIRLFSEAGFDRPTFYYPYPDYKFPIHIYSDEWLPKKGDLRDNNRNFDQDRLGLFDETKVFDELLDSGMFDFYSNSFCVILSAEDLHQ